MPTIPPLIVNAVVGLVAGGIYGLTHYAHRYQTDDEPFNPFLFGATLLVSAGIGLSFGLSGVEVTEQTVIGALAANAAVIAVLEPLLKSATNALGLFPNYS